MHPCGPSVLLQWFMGLALGLTSKLLSGATKSWFAFFCLSWICISRCYLAVSGFAFKFLCHLCEFKYFVLPGSFRSAPPVGMNPLRHARLDPTVLPPDVTVVSRQSLALSSFRIGLS